MSNEPIINKVYKEVQDTLASLTFIKHAASYKTKQHIKLSDSEIADLEKAIQLSMTKTMITACVACEILIGEGLNNKFDDLLKEVMAAVAERMTNGESR